MKAFRNFDERQWEQDAVTFAVGIMGGLAAGLLLARALPTRRGLGGELRERARSVARRLRPALLRRLPVEQQELVRLEEAVLDGFLADTVLGERGIDIGAISPGIIELSGSVWTEDEAQRAVSLANRIPGVRTVVNRLEVDERIRTGSARRRLEPDDLDATFTHQEARTGGMGRRRQSYDTEPNRPDDSQVRREAALAAADRDQYGDEGLSPIYPRTNETPEVQSANRTGYDDDELDNQDPHGRHARYTLDAPPEELNSDARVLGDIKPGIRRGLEQADLSVDGPSPRDRED